MNPRSWPLLLALLASPVRADDGRGPTRIKVRVEERADLVALPPAGDPPTFAVAAITRLIDLLTDLGHGTRADAEERLRTWTGEDFGHTWRGYDSRRPTSDEGRAMQPRYRDW